MRDGLDDVRALLPGVRLAPLDHDRPGGGGRATIRRVAAGADTLIVKTFRTPGPGWVRESAALSVLPAGAPAPRLVAAGRTPPVVVMSDLGAGANVADALLGHDPAAAADAVVSWAEAVATLHRMTAGSREAFRSTLDDRAGDEPVEASPLRTDLDDARRVIESHCGELGVTVPAGAFEEFNALAERLGPDGPAALTPADACPDNNIRVGDRLLLVDFEGAQWRHVAWDVAYLTAPWPSCWCSWRLPDEVSRRAIEAYRAAAGSGYPDTPGFESDLAAAAAGWAFISTSWFLANALGEDPRPNDPRLVAPTRRAIILHRLDGARRTAELPGLAELAGRLHDALAGRWGPVELAYAPAFRD